MNTQRFLIGLLAGILIGETRTAFSQGTFLNLDFESANPPFVITPGGDIFITNALPHWNGYIGNARFDYAIYNSRALDAARISLHDSRSLFGPPLEGNYSVFLQGASPFAPQEAAAIAQTGMVPSDARSVLLYTRPNPFGPATALRLTFGGQTISLTPIGADTPTYRVYGADISPYAGQVGELRFTVNPNSTAWLDNIQFSSNPVPEPGTWALFGLGSALLWCAAKRKRE